MREATPLLLCCWHTHTLFTPTTAGWALELQYHADNVSSLPPISLELGTTQSSLSDDFDSELVSGVCTDSELSVPGQAEDENVGLSTRYP